MKSDEELEMLLDEIPHATSRNLLHHHHRHTHQHLRQQQHHNNHVNGLFPTQTFHGMCGLSDDDPYSHYKHTCASPVSGFSLQSGGSSSSLFSNAQSLSDNGSPPPPASEEFRSHTPSGSSHYPNGVLMDTKVPNPSLMQNANENVIDELGLCRNLSKMYVSNDEEYASSFRDFSLDSKRVQLHDQNNGEKYWAYDNMRKGFSDCVGIQPPAPMSLDCSVGLALPELQQEYKTIDFLGSQFHPGRSNGLYSQQELNCFNGSMRSPWQKTMEPQSSYYHQRGNSIGNLSASMSKLSMNDALMYEQRNGMSWNQESVNFPSSPQLIHPRPPHLGVESHIQCGQRSRAHSNIRSQHRDPEAFNGEDSFILQGELLNYVINKGIDPLRAQNKGFLQDVSVSRHLERRSELEGRPQMAGARGKARAAKLYSPFFLPSKYNSLAEARGYIHLIAKDQHGCRFLQKLFDEGTQQDVQIIFTEIIDHVVELSVNPFGNYLMQKLLEVCNEEQRMQILLMVTEEPGQLVRISLNTHGTRVVQKLIETLKTRQQVSLVISALEPGFLALIKDLNGNHVVQRCLQCLSTEDNKFIFIAAAKYCVDIGTHQHGCCVLQRCISHSTGEYRNKLVAEISASGILLAQDAYGNYVVQFILELKIPSATSTLISQFEGNYVHLSTQKFSSHVVEKCLMVFDDENRSKIIRELLSASHFERLLQDPHANYVIQTALRFSEGPLHNSLVEVIESYKAISRNSPYSKRIFSQKLLKK